MTHNSIFHIREVQSAHRIELLDFLRGAGMLLVLMHHSDFPSIYSQWILAFHMPFMFLLSGYTMHLRPHLGCFKNYLWNRFQRLVIPYFLFEVLNLFVWSASLFLQGGWQDVTEAVYAIFACLNTDGYTGYYGRLWFWPCMFVSDIIFYWILKITPQKKFARQFVLFFMILASLAVSWYTCRVLSYRLPFTADTAFMATAFLLTGYLFGPQISWLLQRSHVLVDVIVLSVSLLALVLSVLSGKSSCMMFINHYGHYGYTLCAAYGGILVFLILAKWLYKLLKETVIPKSIVLWYGYHSLGTFPMHLSVKAFIYQAFPLHYRQWYILLPAMFLLNIPLVNLVTQYFPFMLGKLTFLSPQKENS